MDGKKNNIWKHPWVFSYDKQIWIEIQTKLDKWRNGYLTIALHNLKYNKIQLDQESLEQWREDTAQQWWPEG